MCNNDNSERSSSKTPCPSMLISGWAAQCKNLGWYLTWTRSRLFEKQSHHMAAYCVFFFFWMSHCELLRKTMTTKHVITLRHQLTGFGAVVSNAVVSGGRTAPHGTIRVKRGLCYTLHLREWQRVPIWRGKFCLPSDRVVCLKARGVRCQWRSLPAGPSGRVSVFTDLHFVSLFLVFSGAKANLRDYSGRLASHYMKIKEPEGPEDETDLCECLRPMVLE